ncbi:ABC transporter substrate-binding protein [Bacillus sp. FSL K6-6540]|uniref:ABC transporter substrate-binding protein n=1 Tax=Bacillus sp. FSL K6-6540 TaxID=2921512 RepID=UPI0030FA3BF8
MSKSKKGLSLMLMLAMTVSFAPLSSAAEDGTGSISIPNRYNTPYSVDDDEIYIFTANYKPFEYSTNEDDHTGGDVVFNEIIGDKLREAFPGLKIKVGTWDYPVRYEDLDAAGIVPDIIIDNPYNRIDRDFEHRGWVQDMTPMIEQSGIDLGSLNQAAVEMVKSRSDGGIYGVPLFIDDYVLYYNKKIFDKFGVKYPTPGMTYDEIFKLAKKLTTQDGLDAYKGFMQHPDNYLQYNQLGLYPFQPTDSEEPAPADVKVDITSPEWNQLGENIDRFLWLPRNGFTTVNDFLKGDMSRPGHVAMAVDTLQKLPAYVGDDLFIKDEDEEIYHEWLRSIDVGVTSVPVLKNRSETTYQPNTMAAFIPPQARHQEKAIEIVKWLVSEEGQVALSRNAIKGVLETPAVVDSFGDDIPGLANVDTSGVYWGSNAVVQNYQNTEYWDIPLYSVFRQHVLKDAMSVEAAFTVTETVDIPNYIKSQSESGKDW